MLEFVTVFLLSSSLTSSHCLICSHHSIALLQSAYIQHSADSVLGKTARQTDTQIMNMKLNSWLKSVLLPVKLYQTGLDLDDSKKK